MAIDHDTVLQTHLMENIAIIQSSIGGGSYVLSEMIFTGAKYYQDLGKTNYPVFSGAVSKITTASTIAA